MLKLGGKVVATGAVALALSSGSAYAALGDIDSYFVAVFDVPGVTFNCGGGYCFDTGTIGDPAVAGTSVSGSSVSLGPNYTFYAAGDPFWDNGGDGNKQVVASSFGEEVGVAVGTGTVTIEGCVDSYTLDSGYAVQAFVKLLDPSAGFSDILGARLPITGAGSFSLSADLTVYEGDVALIPQAGFEVVGLNGNPANAAALGSVNLTLGAACAAPPPSGGPTPGDPNAIPTLPIWGLLGLVGLVGWFGSRKLSKRS